MPLMVGVFESILEHDSSSRMVTKAVTPIAKRPIFKPLDEKPGDITQNQTPQTAINSVP